MNEGWQEEMAEFLANIDIGFRGASRHTGGCLSESSVEGAMRIFFKEQGVSDEEAALMASLALEVFIGAGLWEVKDGKWYPKEVSG